MLLSHLDLAREGHINQVFHILAYLNKYHNTKMVFIPATRVEESYFELKDWTSIDSGHIQGTEDLPPNMT